MMKSEQHSSKNPFRPSPSLSLFFCLGQNRNRFLIVTIIGMWLSGGLMQTYADGKTTMSVYERKTSIREFYVIIFPSLLQLQRGVTDLEDRKQKEVCTMRYLKKDEFERANLSDIDLEREEECGICMEINSMVVLPNCTHSLCLKCYRDWHGRSESCPFCRDCLKRVNSGDLWIYTEKSEIVDLSSILGENRKRLFIYIDKLPLVVSDHVRGAL